MKTVVVGFFQESEGVNSNIRLMSFILLMGDLVLMLWHEIKHKGDSSAETYSPHYVYFQIVVLSYIFFPKIVSKIIEMIAQLWVKIKGGDNNGTTTVKQTTEVKTG